jgi:hypothetical protein
MDCAQMLEDIRINTKLFKDYRGVRQLYRRFSEWAVERNRGKYGPEYGKLVIIGLQAMGHGKLSWDKVMAKELRRDAKVQAVVAQARRARGTKHVIPLAVQLGEHLFPGRKKRQQDQEDAQKRWEKFKDRVDDLQANRTAHQMKWSASQRQQSQAEANAQSARAELDPGQERNQNEAAKKHADDAAQHAKAVEDIDKQLNHPDVQAAKARKDAADEALHKMKQAVKQVAESICFGLEAAKESLTSFDAPKFSEQLRATLSDTISRAIEQQSLVVQERLNKKRLDRVYTQPETVWEGSVMAHRPQARVAFLLDYSASMNAALPGAAARRKQGVKTLSRIGLLHGTFMRFAKALVDVMDEHTEGAVDASAIWFSVNNKQWMFGKEFRREVEQARNLPYSGGGTSLTPALRQAVEALDKEEENAGSGIRKIIVVMTDTEYDGKANQYMENELPNDIGLVCVAVGNKLEKIPPKTRRLFRHAVTDEEQCDRVLVETLEEGLL